MEIREIIDTLYFQNSASFGCMLSMEGIGERIRQARKAKGLTQKDLARLLSVHETAVSGWERQKSRTYPETRRLPDIARVLNVSEAWLVTGDSDGVVPAPGVSAPTRREMPADVPVYGTTAGSDEGAFQLAMGAPLDYVRRPDRLARRADVYALIIVGDSMEPAFRHGSLIFVSERMPPRIGDDVVIQLAAEGEEVTAMVKRLVRRRADGITVEQFNPPAEFSIEKERIRALHRVLTLEDLFGI